MIGAALVLACSSPSTVTPADPTRIAQTAGLGLLERAPLSPVEGRATRAEGYWIRPVSLQVYEGLRVSAALFLPDTPGPHPGVLVAVGHFGQGKTAGRGTKGAKARGQMPQWFEGGQMPLVRRIPKRGFTNIHRKTVDIVNLRDLGDFAEGATVDVASLAEQGLVGGKAPVKLLGEGDAPAKLVIKVHRISGSAREKIEAAGGSVELLT